MLPPPEIAGYRVLRRLHRGARSEILLARDPEGAEPVALKVSARGSRVDAEIAALHRAAGQHVVRLLDVHLERDTAVLVLERLASVAVGDLLRRDLEAGEVVTLLAPVARELRRLHDGGTAHGALGVDHVGLREDGTPVLLGFGAARGFASGLPEVALERVDAVVADRERMRALAGVVLGRVGGGREAAARRFAERLASGTHEEVLPLLSEELFDLAGPRPVRSAVGDESHGVGEAPTATPAAAASTGRVAETTGWTEAAVGLTVDPGAWQDPGALIPRGRVGPESVVARIAAFVGRLGGRAESASGGSADGVSEASRGIPADSVPATLRDRPGLAALRERWRGWTAGRRRLVLVAAVGGAVLLGGLLLVPATPAETTALGPPDVSSSATPAVPATAGDAGLEQDDTGSPGSVGAEVVGAGDAVTGDDPLAAAALLLAARRDCIRDLSAVCLADVDQVGEAAMRDDLAVLEAARAGEPVRLDAPPVERLVLTERLGGSALIHLPEGSSPSSVLLLDTPDGWRIRAYLGAPAIGDAQG